MTIYRRIYEKHFGSIPVDEDGRTYDIHHLDGDNKNNKPENLVALPIKDHYNVHYEKGDWNACLIMAPRMKLDPQIISELSRKTQEKRLLEGTHNFLCDNPMKKRLEDGTHHFYGGKVQGENSRKRVNEGTHNFLHQRKEECPYCGRVITAGPMKNHIKKCKGMYNGTRN